MGSLAMITSWSDKKNVIVVHFEFKSYQNGTWVKLWVYCPVFKYELLKRKIQKFKITACRFLYRI